MYNQIPIDARNDPHKQYIFDTSAIGLCGPDQFEKDVEAMHSLLAFRSNFVKAELAAAGVQLPTSDPIDDSVAPMEAQSSSSVAPGSIVHIGGVRFGGSVSADFEPYDLIQGNTYVEVDGVRVPMLAASANSIDIQIPWNVAMEPTAVVVIVDGAVSLSKQVDVADAAPYILAVVHADGSLVSKQRPVRPGEILIVYASGLGAVDAVVEVGEVTKSDTPVHTTGNVSICVGSDPLTILFSGLSPGSVALYQLNVLVAATVPLGSASLTLSVGEHKTVTPIDTLM